MTASQLIYSYLQAWIGTETWAESQAYLQNHQALLSDTAVKILAIWERQAPSEEIANIAIQHRELLQAAQQNGIAFAYRPLLQKAGEPSFTVDELKIAIQHIAKTPDTAVQRQRICQAAISLIDPSDDPISWGAFHNELGMAYFQDLTADREEVTEKAIASYQQALKIFTPQNIPIEWANIQNNLANVYLYRPTGIRQDNLQQAIHYAKEALTILDNSQPHVNPDMWQTLAPFLTRGKGMALRNLGAALQDSGDIQEAIPRLQTSVSFFDPQENPIEWQNIHYRLGQCFLDSPNGDRATHVRQAIHHLETIQTIVDKTIFPDIWLEIHHRLGLAYADRMDGNRSKHIEKGIKLLRLAIDGYAKTEDKENWASAHADLGMLYIERHQGEHGQNIETAIELLHRGLTILTREKYPDTWFKLHNNLGQAYLNRVAGDRKQNVELSITHMQNGLSVLTAPHQRQWQAMLKNHLCYALSERMTGELADNIEQALTYGDESLAILEETAPSREWASTHNNLSKVYGQRIIGDREANIRKSIFHAKQALTVFTKESDAVRWAQNNLNLGSMLMELGYLQYGRIFPDTLAQNPTLSDLYTKEPLFDDAMVAIKSTLEVYTLDDYPIRWATSVTNLAVMYLDYPIGDKQQHIQEAIHLLTQVGHVYTQEATPERWARTEMNLSVAWSRLAEMGDTDAVAKATHHAKQALTFFTADTYPKDYGIVARNLGHTYLDAQSWGEAAVWYQRYTAVTRNQLAEAYSEEGRLASAVATSDIAGLHAFAHLKNSNIPAALETLEAGKAQLLSDALRQTAHQIAQLPHRHQQAIAAAQNTVRSFETLLYQSNNPTIAERQQLANARQQLQNAIQNAQTLRPDLLQSSLTAADILQTPPPQTALIMPLLTELGCAILLVPHGLAALTADHVVWLEGNRETLLNPLMIDGVDSLGWFDAYERRQQNHHLWQEAVDEVTERIWQILFHPILSRLYRDNIKHLVILPQGGLQWLPLHAAWQQRGSKRHYLLQDFTVQYAPSIHAYRQALSQQRQLPSNTTCLAITDPTQTLDYTEHEVALIKTRFPHTTTLSNATIATLLEEEAHTLFHFAGHGSHDFDDVQQSGLFCADGVLTLHAIQRQMTLSQTRLVVLSACETGMVDVNSSPEEFVGLPTGFLSAGVAGVVSALWPVADNATMTLMAGFYKQLQEGATPAAALQQAQLWVSTATNAMLADFFASQNQMTLWRYFTSREHPSESPFANPDFWAAFTLTGC